MSHKCSANVCSDVADVGCSVCSKFLCANHARHIDPNIYERFTNRTFEPVVDPRNHAVVQHHIPLACDSCHHECYSIKEGGADSKEFKRAVEISQDKRLRTEFNEEYQSTLLELERLTEKKNTMDVVHKFLESIDD